MRIAVIGAGNVGRAIARLGVRDGHAVIITARDEDHAREAAEETGASPAASNAEAATGADVVVIAVPHPELGTVAAEIADVATGVVIDSTNQMKPDLSGLVTPDRSTAEQLQERLPRASVVKAFNTVLAGNMADPVVDGTPLDGFYAGDDAEAKAKVAELLTAAGYRPFDAGPLSAALALEHMAVLNIALNARNGWAWRSGWKLIGPVG